MRKHCMFEHFFEFLANRTLKSQEKQSKSIEKNKNCESSPLPFLVIFRFFGIRSSDATTGDPGPRRNQKIHRETATLF